MSYTYCHISNLTKKPFYFGKGSCNRMYVVSKRSVLWKEMAKDGYSTEILAKWPTDKEACDHERFLIQTGRELGWNLANKNAGGSPGGASKHMIGKKLTTEVKEKISATLKSKPRKVGSTRMCAANSKTKNPSWSGYWVTPDGIFNTLCEAEEHYKITQTMIMRRCKGYQEKYKEHIRTYLPVTGWSFRSKGE